MGRSAREGYPGAAKGEHRSRCRPISSEKLLAGQRGRLRDPILQLSVVESVASILGWDPPGQLAVTAAPRLSGGGPGGEGNYCA